jgi:hypothetical protein
MLAPVASDEALHEPNIGRHELSLIILVRESSYQACAHASAASFG